MCEEQYFADGKEVRDIWLLYKDTQADMEGDGEGSGEGVIARVREEEGVEMRRREVGDSKRQRGKRGPDCDALN